MRIAIPTNDKKIVSVHFGRTSFISVYDTETENFEHYDNVQNKESAHGAGTQTAANLIDMKVRVLLSPNLGPKAFDVLNSTDIELYEIENTNIDINEAVKLYKNGALKKMNAPTK